MLTDVTFLQDFTAADGRDWELSDVIPYVPLASCGGFPMDIPQLQYDKGYCASFTMAIAVGQLYGLNLSPLFQHHYVKKIDGLPAGTEGTTDRASLKVAKDHGFILEEHLPYLVYKDTPLEDLPITDEMIEEGLSRRIAGFAKCRSIEGIKQALNAGFPVVYGHIVSTAYAYDEDGWIRTFFGDAAGGHMSGIHWWDDNARFTFNNPVLGDITHQGFFDGMQTWLDRNMDTPAFWGDDGKAHLSYQIITEQTDLGMTFLDNVWAIIPTEDQIVNFRRRKKVVEFQLDSNYYKINGNTFYSDVQPQIINGRMMLPVRMAAEALGAKVEWFASTRTVKFTDVDKDIVELVIDSDISKVNDIELKRRMDQAATIVDNRCLVPIRFVAESLAALVGWDGETRTATITKY